jgi:hypothetical protein
MKGPFPTRSCTPPTPGILSYKIGEDAAAGQSCATTAPDWGADGKWSDSSPQIADKINHTFASGALFSDDLWAVTLPL